MAHVIVIGAGLGGVPAAFTLRKHLAKIHRVTLIGAFFILDDPIFNGLAISLIFGILVSTALTLLLIPLLYFGYITRSRASAALH